MDFDEFIASLAEDEKKCRAHVFGPTGKCLIRKCEATEESE